MNDNMVQLFAKTRLCKKWPFHMGRDWAHWTCRYWLASTLPQLWPQYLPNSGASHTKIATLGLVFKPRVMLEDSGKVKAPQARATLSWTNLQCPIISVP